VAGAFDAVGCASRQPTCCSLAARELGCLKLMGAHSPSCSAASAAWFFLHHRHPPLFFITSSPTTHQPPTSSRPALTNPRCHHASQALLTVKAQPAAQAEGELLRPLMDTNLSFIHPSHCSKKRVLA
jgi:hypothetical protein